MAQVDVTVEIDIAAEPTDVAGVMFDPHRDPEWIKAVTEVTVHDPGIAPGARVTRRGQFLGREIGWTTEVEGFRFPHVLVLRIAEGPFVGTVRYEIERAGAGSRVRIRNTGTPGSFGFLPAALLEAPMRSALASDLARLKALVEAAVSRP